MKKIPEKWTNLPKAHTGLTAWGYYDALACGYDELHGEEQARKVFFIQRIVKPCPSTRILDVGCGTGVSMNSWECHIEGIEPSPEMASIAKKRGLKVTVSPAEQLPFPADSFDWVIAVTSAHHVSKKGFAEMARVAPRAVLTMPKKGKVELTKERIRCSWRIVSEHDCFQDIAWECVRKMYVESSNATGTAFRGRGTLHKM